MRLATWNLWNGGGDRIPAIADVLRALDADVVALQEANDPAKVDALAESLRMHAFWGEANSAFAVAWLSREPARPRNHRLPELEKTLLELEWRGLRLFATHLTAGRTVDDEPRRVAEVRAILDALDGRGDLLVGDFNAVHPEDEVGEPPPDEALDHVSRQPIADVLDAGLTDVYRALHADRGWTYMSTKPWARIDYVFAGVRMRPRECRVVVEAASASDHLPLFAELG